MLVLRIETATGEGCYTARRPAISANDAHNDGYCPLDSGLHPNPYDDARLCPQWRKIVGDSSGYHPTITNLGNRFGFVSAEQYHRWFYSEESRAILSTSYQVSVYLVPDDCVAEGDSQCVFEAARAKLLGRFPCDLPIEDALVRVQVFQRREDRAAVSRLASSRIAISLAPLAA
jgi:hypothetical protein